MMEVQKTDRMHTVARFKRYFDIVTESLSACLDQLDPFYSIPQQLDNDIELIINKNRTNESIGPRTSEAQSLVINDDLCMCTIIDDQSMII